MHRSTLPASSPAPTPPLLSQVLAIAGLSVFNATPESWMSCETSPGTENMANLLLKNAARFGFSGYALSSKTPSAMLQKPELLVR